MKNAPTKRVVHRVDGPTAALYYQRSGVDLQYCNTRESRMSEGRQCCGVVFSSGLLVTRHSAISLPCRFCTSACEQIKRQQSGYTPSRDPLDVQYSTVLYLLYASQRSQDRLRLEASEQLSNSFKPQKKHSTPKATDRGHGPHVQGNPPVSPPRTLSSHPKSSARTT